MDSKNAVHNSTNKLEYKMATKTLLKVIDLAQKRVATLQKKLDAKPSDNLRSQLIREYDLVDNARRDLNLKLAQKALEAA
jgi:hypothetical protein